MELYTVAGRSREVMLALSRTDAAGPKLPDLRGRIGAAGLARPDWRGRTGAAQPMTSECGRCDRSAWNDDWNGDGNGDGNDYRTLARLPGRRRLWVPESDRPG